MNVLRLLLAPPRPAHVTPPVPARERPPIIDMHLHARFPHPPHIPAGAPSLCRPDPCQGEGEATATSAQSLEGTLAEMERHNIVKGFLSSPDLETLDEWVSAAPGRFMAAPFILKPDQFDIEALGRDLRSGRLAGLGEIGTQLYGDLSTIAWVLPRTAFYVYLQGLVSAGFSKRLMFGSDQMRWPETIGRAIESIEGADFLSEEQKRDIFYNNAVRFLRLEPEAGRD